jgi:hypothetical protein
MGSASWRKVTDETARRPNGFAENLHLRFKTDGSDNFLNFADAELPPKR